MIEKIITITGCIFIILPIGILLWSFVIFFITEEIKKYL